MCSEYAQIYLVVLLENFKYGDLCLQYSSLDFVDQFSIAGWHGSW